MKQKNILLSILLLIGLVSCSDNAKENDLQQNQLRVTFNALSNMTGEHSVKKVKSSVIGINESKVETISLLIFDKETKLLETQKINIPAATPSELGSLGEITVGELVVNLSDDKAKEILTIANKGSNKITPDIFEEGVTTYDEALKTITLITGEDDLTSPFTMTGYTSINSGATEAVVTLRRIVAKLTVKNKGEDKGLSISTLQLINIPNAASLFTDMMPESYSLIDYEAKSFNEKEMNFYLLPVKKELNNLKLRIEGQIKTKTFNYELDIKPSDLENNLLDIESNHRYSISLDVKDGGVELKTEILLVEDWEDGEDITAIIPNDNNEVNLIQFNGLLWADRNLGATNNDLETDWENSIGLFYQWGRNTAFSTTNYQTVSGPLSSVMEANSDETREKFIIGGFRDWISSSDNNLWQTYDSQPCSDKFRLPTEKELLGIFTARGVITNMVSGPKIVTDEALVKGISTAHYWGDNTKKRVYGIKCQGTEDAYYMMWEYLKTQEGNPYLKISRWEASKDATFASKAMTDVRIEFEAFAPAKEVLILPGAGYITGSNGTYNKSEGGYYWSSSLAGDNKVYRAEFNTGRMSMTEPYASRVSGHTIRCVGR